MRIAKVIGMRIKTPYEGSEGRKLWRMWESEERMRVPYGTTSGP